MADRASRACEYCLIHEDDSGYVHHIDHIISLKHHGTSVADNLAFACILCNRYKGSDIATMDPVTGEVVRLFNPRKDLWLHHFELNGPVIRPLTNIAEATIRVLKLNTPVSIEERRVLQLLGNYPSR